ncbi:beta-1,3-galactosyltransferase 5-like [Mizuhopecten yessoensis]|uniref:Hexosyltransferase n=1 Tax=Mizuhopecten yessoensis TaxID=6573 RepID=A0A210QYL6_MIZYE|nr:beta-1,3-galactosyltransferase 5-like [Mizuhopecten yessoensis]XP_021346448.1 beta-1,3-galactosyltransferase 5-like [Mizuhopecten yessoensis]OWF53824.1 Beta-1,3-galactosyltransferase brn [Mizuhopecten yessoensis]
MTTFLKVLKGTLFLVSLIATGMCVWNVYRLNMSRNRYLYLEHWKSKENMTNAKYIRADTGIQTESKPGILRQVDSLKTLLRTNISAQPTKAPWSNFSFPLDVDMIQLVQKLRSNIPVEHKPVFVYGYTFTHYKVDRCVDGSPFFIFLIKSAVTNVESRAAIRKTWANSALIEKYNSVRMFLVGTPDKRTVLSAVEEENNIHKDILIMSFRENYYNNTLKTIGAIHWTVQHCNRSKFVIFVDDDMLVSTTRLVEFLETNVTLPTFFGGHVAKDNIPFRNETSKWYVSLKDYPYSVYPPMASAGFMVMTINFVIDIHFASQYTKEFNFDDCYLGMVAYKLHVKPVYIRSVFVEPMNITRNTHLIAAHGFPPSKMISSWSELQKQFTLTNR